MYNPLEYGQNYSMKSGSLQIYYRDEIDDVNDNASDDQSKIVEKTLEGPPRPPQLSQNSDGFQLPRPERPPQPPGPALNVDITIPFKHLSNVWRFLDLTLVNCEIELDLSWAKDCVLSQHHNNITGAVFQINNLKLYVPVVTLSIIDNIKFLENLKQRFKRTISWNKYRSEITTEPKNNNLNYLIDPTFRNVNRLFVLSFKSGNNDHTRHSFYKYYISFVEILMH